MNAQTLDTKHSYFYRNSDGSTIHYLFSTATKGKELIQRDNVLIAQQTSYSYYDKRTRKHYNSYGGGYYFGVRGTCETNFTYSYDGNIILIHLQGNSQTKVEAYIHPKSSENLSEHGGYKDNIMRQWKQDLPRNPDVNRCKSHMKDVLEYDKRSNKDILAYKIDDNRKLKQVNILSYNTCLEECDSIINSYIKTNNIEPSLHLIYSHLDSKVNDNWMFLKEDRQKLDTYFKEKIERLRTERENTELLEDIKNKIIPFLDDCKKIVRPLNFPEGNVGRGICEIELAGGKKLLVAQVMGRAFMEDLDCPVQALEKVLKSYIMGANISAILVDIHAEATAEKLAFAHVFDGKVSIVAGTHTHVPTADARIFPKGTAYITDVGMCGDYNSVLGFEPDASIRRLCKKFPSERLIPAKGNGTLYAIYVQTDDKTGLALNIEQIVMK